MFWIKILSIEYFTTMLCITHFILKIVWITIVFMEDKFKELNLICEKTVNDVDNYIFYIIIYG